MRTIYNRPAEIEACYSDVIRVRFQDNGVMDFVPVDHVAEVC